MNQKIELNYHLFWKIHNFYIACPNTTEESPCTPCMCIELSIHTKNATFHIIEGIEGVKGIEFQSFNESKN